MNGKALKTQVEITVPVRFGDTDPYGVIYFASYFRYCHHGIEEFLRHHGLPPHEVLRNSEEGFGLPVVSASCDFLRPVRYGDALRLVVAVSEVKEKSVRFSFTFYKDGGDEPVAKGSAAIVAIGRDWRARTLPERVLKVL